jgi:threonine dehydrogenase-like Zn-dependent dehydrogenase
VEKLLELTGGEGVDLLFDATRTPETLPAMLKAAAHAGRILVTGSVPGKVEIDLFHELQLREISIIGVFQPAAPTVAHPYNPWTQRRNRVEFLKLLADGTVRVDNLISAAPAWSEAPEVYEMIRKGPGEWLGIVFDWG